MELLLSPTKVQALKMSTAQTVAASHSSFLPEERPFMMELRKPRWTEYMKRKKNGKRRERGERQREGQEEKGK